MLWNADLTLTGAIEQGRRSSFNFTRQGVTADLGRDVTPIIRTSGSLLVQHHADVRRAPRRGGTGHHRSPLSAGPAVERSPARSCATPATTWLEPIRGDFFSGEVSLALARTGRGGRFPEDLPAGLLVQAPARAARRHPGDAGVHRPGRRLPARIAADRRRRQPDRRRPGHHRGPAGERTVLRRRRHDHPRLRARHRRHAEDDQPEWISARRQRRVDHERRAAHPRVRRTSARRCSATAATSSNG